MFAGRSPDLSADQAQKQVTQLLADWSGGNTEALNLLTPLVYGELRNLARTYLARESKASTLQPTALVHEAYLRLVAQDMPDWKSRAHFFGVAAHLMRQVLVDHARRHLSAKRGARAPKASLEEALTFAQERSWEMVALDDALNALAKLDDRKCKIIELRFFGGLSVEETAHALDISTATVGREQRMAEAWLHKELSAADASSD